MTHSENKIQTILVLGATGLVGKTATRQLVADGFEISALTREATRAQKCLPGEVMLVEGDLTENEQTLRKVMEEADGLLVALPETLVESVMPSIMASALLGGIKQVVYISGNTVCAENAWHPMIRGHFAAECCIENSGVPYTILKPTMIMDTIPSYAGNGKPLLIGQQPHAWSWIHTEDIARYVSRAFTTEKALNRQFPLVGNRRTTFAAAIEMFNHSHMPHARPVRTMNLRLAKFLSLFIGRKFRYVVSIFEYFGNHRENGDGQLTRSILGFPRVELQDFISGYAA